MNNSNFPLVLYYLKMLSAIVKYYLSYSFNNYYNPCYNKFRTSRFKSSKYWYPCNCYQSRVSESL